MNVFSWTEYVSSDCSLAHTHSLCSHWLASTGTSPRPPAHPFPFAIYLLLGDSLCSLCTVSLMTELATHFPLSSALSVWWQSLPSISPCPPKILSCSSQKSPRSCLRAHTGKLRDLVLTLETSFPGQFHAHMCFLQLQQFASVYPGGAQAQELKMSVFPFNISKTK